MQTPDKDRLDLWLDQALRQQSSIAARDGMEGRVIAILRSRDTRTHAVRKWIVIFGSPAVAVLLIALLWRGERADVHPRNLNAANATGHSAPVEQASGKTSLPLGSSGGEAKVASVARRHGSTRALNTEPRLAHFPSMRAPSPEELVLARYVESYPQEATLVSKEQQEFEVAVQKAQQEAEAQVGISNE